ncbi:MAG: TonB family protein [Pseudomonadota bacterium]
MKILVVITSILILSLGSLALASEQPSQLMDTVTIDKTTINKALNKYALSTRDRIQGVWTTPLNLVTADALKGKVAVMYEIERDGSLSHVRLLRGSGNSEMDRSLLNAIRSAAPFASFPGDISAKKVQVKANFIIADLPTVPVLKVEHRTDGQSPPEPSQVAPQKKYIWGVPAGTALRKDVSIPSLENLREISGTVIEPPHSRKFEWGDKNEK